MNKKQILIADDNRDSCNATRILLEAAGFSVMDTACDGLETVEKIEKLRPDVVILDIVMPRLDGYSILRTLNEMKLSKRPKIII